MKPVLIGLYSSDMRSGKSTVASMLTERLFGMTQSFAAPMYDFIIPIAAEFIGSEMDTHRWLQDRRKDYADVPELGVTLRTMLQTLGTTWGRDCVHKDLWTKLAEKKALKALRSYSVIFDDMRFPNEFEMIQRNGGKCIRIFRPLVDGPRGDTRIGEGLLDNPNDYPFDYYINNVGTVSDLKRNVWSFVERLEQGKL